METNKLVETGGKRPLHNLSRVCSISKIFDWAKFRNSATNCFDIFLGELFLFYFLAYAKHSEGNLIKTNNLLKKQCEKAITSPPLFGLVPRCLIW